jgi:hypothetical protein
MVYMDLEEFTQTDWWLKLDESLTLQKYFGIHLHHLILRLPRGLPPYPSIVTQYVFLSGVSTIHFRAPVKYSFSHIFVINVINDFSS